MLAAGTAAALVPIRSITRRVPKTSPQSLAVNPSAKDHPRVSYEDGQETVTYIPEGVEDAGETCLALLAELKGIQSGKLEDKRGWRYEVTEADGKAVVAEVAGKEEAVESVDQME